MPGAVAALSPATRSASGVSSGAFSISIKPDHVGVERADRRDDLVALAGELEARVGAAAALVAERPADRAPALSMRGEVVQHVVRRHLDRAADVGNAGPQVDPGEAHRLGRVDLVDTERRSSRCR